MNRYSISSVFKFLVGIVLIQCATLIMYMAAAKTQLGESWIIFGLLALTISFFAALWFTSIANHAQKDAVSRAKEGFLREREKIRVQAEKEKHKVIKQSHKQIVKETSRVQTKASFKTKAALVGLFGLGAMMIFTQFVTLGLLTLSTAGGALGGYGVRVRQDYLGRKRKQDQKLSEPNTVTRIETKPTPPTIAGLIKKTN